MLKWLMPMSLSYFGRSELGLVDALMFSEVKQ